MKHSKVLGLLVTMAATIAFAGTASATSVTTTTGIETATPTIHTVNEGGHVVLANPIANIECSVTSEGSVTAHGSGVGVSIPLNHLAFTGCTNSWHVTVTALGTQSIFWTSGHNGVLISTGTKIHTTRLGLVCIYETSNTSIGTVTGGSPATIHTKGAVLLNKELSSGLCGSEKTYMLSGADVTTGSIYVR